jgi:hypothetical protein
MRQELRGRPPFREALFAILNIANNRMWTPAFARFSCENHRQPPAATRVFASAAKALSLGAAASLFSAATRWPWAGSNPSGNT